MNEKKNNNFYAQNQQLYQGLFGASETQRRDLLDKLLLVNTGLIQKAIGNSGYKQYNIAEFEDILQTARMIYIEIIQKNVNDKNQNYPETLYPELLRTLQESLSRPYANGGLSVPYASRKVMNRKDYEKASKIGMTTAYTNDFLESNQMMKLEAHMVEAFGGMSFEDKICSMIVIKEILDIQSPVIKEMFTDRYINSMTYSELGEKFDCSEDHARYVIKKLTEQIKKELD